MAQTTTLVFAVIGQSLERLDDNRIVEKAKNYVEAQFSFNEVWENTTKAILIEGSNLKYKVYLNEENKCLIPNRVVRHDGFTLNVVGEDNEKFITITTNDLFISILSNNATDDTPSYVEEIESETLDVTRESEKYNIEIPETYKNCYNIISSDITNITPITENEFSATLSESLIEVITTFKQNLYMDWENEFPEFLVALDGVKANNLTPTKKMTFGDDPILYYVFSASDSWFDFSVVLYYENDTWKFMIIHNNLVTQEDLNIALQEKSSVVANPDTTGDEETLSTVEIDGAKYKVGGGNEVHLYKHHLKLGGRNSNFDNMPLYVSFDIYLSTNTPFTTSSIKSWLNANGYENSTNLLSVVSSESLSPKSGIDRHIIIGIYGDTYIRTMIQYIDGENVGKLALTFFTAQESCSDTITQIF